MRNSRSQKPVKLTISRAVGRLILVLSAGALSLLVFLAESPPDAQERSAAGTQASGVVRVGVAPILQDAPFFIAKERGYFSEQGVAVDMRVYPDQVRPMQILARGDLEFAIGGISLMLFQLIADGAPVRVVTDRALLLPGYESHYWMLRRDLAETIKSVGDLRGRPIALNFMGTPLLYPLGRTLEQFGVGLSDVEVKYVEFSGLAQAFRERQIAAALAAGPAVRQLEESGLAVKWFGISRYINSPHMQMGGVLAYHPWLEAHRELAARFLIAWLRGARDYRAAMMEGRKRQEVISLLVRHLSIKDPAVLDRMEWVGISTDFRPQTASITDQLRWYRERGLISKPLMFDQIVDASHVEEATRRLGLGTSDRQR